MVGVVCSVTVVFTVVESHWNNVALSCQVRCWVI